jgi:hypothetical protein
MPLHVQILVFPQYLSYFPYSTTQNLQFLDYLHPLRSPVQIFKQYLPQTPPSQSTDREYTQSVASSHVHHYQVSSRRSSLECLTSL